MKKPVYHNHVGMSAPSRSGTTHLTVETVLQGEGWDNGWATWKVKVKAVLFNFDGTLLDTLADQHLQALLPDRNKGLTFFNGHSIAGGIKGTFVFSRILWLNPSDNQGVHFQVDAARLGTVWEDHEFKLRAWEAQNGPEDL